jgi:hypothetical protein
MAVRLFSESTLFKGLKGNRFNEFTRISASGGTITTYSDGVIIYKVHKFTTSGTFTISGGYGTINYLVLAGGGAGGSSNTDAKQGGSGGAGGLLISTVNLGIGTYSVGVGPGASATTIFTNTSGADGSSSNFAAIATTTGGGAGGGSNKTGGTGISGQGNKGGDSGAGQDGSGGGGASGEGGDGSGGTAGAGTNSSITGTSVLYARGGSRSGNVAQTGNTGFGGNGGYHNFWGGNAGDSGVVILSYRSN